jgi:hypothetical protein
MELGRTVVWFHPQAQRDLSVKASESDAQIIGRVAADVVSMVVGVAAIDAGTGLGTGGVVACATGVGCLAGAGAIAAAVPVIAEGAGVATNGAIGMGENLALLAKRGDTWRVGDPINAPTKNGYPSWSTVRRRYWMNRAQSALPGEFSPANLERMRQGLAPLHEEFGVPMELQHIHGRNIPDAHNMDNLQEVWPWEHSDIDPFRYYTGPRPQ